MIWYLGAYAVFWAVLFGYLMGVSSRQQKLVERAEYLTRRLADSAPDSPRSGSDSPRSAPDTGGAS